LILSTIGHTYPRTISGGSLTNYAVSSIKKAYIWSKLTKNGGFLDELPLCNIPHSTKTRLISQANDKMERKNSAKIDKFENI
jgi:hypothetical protein